ncbi:hypothetical protein ACFFQF_16965 [Haladaptatus pallidirubidus]|uniref:hypothetical protein n=1 Tax=Haladaptatus pallidirubidus TaxID=1008152 RepID=UPI001D12261A|nr:hypothetical protein [Haladaptatus pallidirubidus]
MELLLDLIEMAPHVEPFDDILSSRPLKIFFFRENLIGLLVREFSLIRECCRDRVERFLCKWSEWRFAI